MECIANTPSSRDTNVSTTTTARVSGVDSEETTLPLNIHTSEPARHSFEGIRRDTRAYPPRVCREQPERLKTLSVPVRPAQQRTSYTSTRGTRTP
ncbi:hypothetical protein EDF36_3702 [Rathayibacter sp. PhB152]|nr:hypothetical protein EDF36_3702 [Rathayibacter sp. PhB152]